MGGKRRLAGKFLAGGVTLLTLLATVSMGHADDSAWRPLEAIALGDHQLAERALAPEFGDKPNLWPCWLDIRARIVSAGAFGSMLIVRYPRRATCGAYGYKMFGPVRSGRRAPLGQPLCGGDLTPEAVLFRGVPDLSISTPASQDPNETRPDRVQHWHWTGTAWQLRR